MGNLRKIGLLACLWMLILPSQAAMISTAEIVVPQNRSQMVNLLQREEVQQTLIEMGVDPDAALDRVNRMTDHQIASLSGQITNVPAGGDGFDMFLGLIMALILVALLL